MHCLLQQDRAAALHPPLMYGCIIALLLLPLDIAFKVSLAADKLTERVCYSMTINFIL